MRLRTTSSAIATGAMAASSRADCAPWASGTSQLHQPRRGRNGFAERLIGSIRRECLDHVIVLGEAHLRRILKSYAAYYNCVRTHRSLNKDAPVTRPVQRVGVISSRTILGGLHHRYARV
jgi:Integrase core domain